MAKTKFEEMFDRLPSNIKETEILRLSTKKVLAALLELLLHSEARESRVIYASNARLRKLSGISSNDLLPSIEQLIDYDLITRKVGTVRKEGEKSEASEYTINIKKLKEPLVEKTFDDLFSEFIEDEESLEMPINTAITTTITTSIATSTTTATSTTSSIENTTSTETSSTTFTIETFRNEVKPLLECKYEDELINKKLDIIKSLNTKRLEIGECMYNRCLSYLNRMYSEMCDVVQAEASTVDEIPF